MKALKITTIIVFAVIIILPLTFFNFKPNSVSAIDNRLLAENPFSEGVEGDLSQNIEGYIGDRIGFREDMITAYTLLNDKLFGKMVHPSYSYGKDGYVFGAGITAGGEFSDYHIVFADMVKELQTYCEDRGVPFLFVFNPAKPAVLSDYIGAGINYNREWVDMFFAELDKRGVNYLDNTTTLKKANEDGIVVYNQKYDANHWNDTGSFYGTNAILEKLSERVANVYINKLSDFKLGEETMYSLPVSKFPIEESVPKYELTCDYTDNSSLYSSEIALHPSYRGFGSYINEQRKSEGAPSALVFQGSYMIGFGYKYLINSFSEYNYVHDYQNVTDLPYYFNIFKPDCVIFEVAEYTFSEGFFEQERMKNIDYNKPISSFNEKELETLSNENLTVTQGNTLTKVEWKTDTEFSSVWLLAEAEYDMKKIDRGYEATIPTAVYKEYHEKLKIVIKK